MITMIDPVTPDRESVWASSIRNALLTPKRRQIDPLCMHASVLGIQTVETVLRVGLVSENRGWRFGGQFGVSVED
jgi:hypothetical protein